MKKLVVVAAVIAGLVGPVGSAAAESVAPPVAVAAPVGSSSADVFCAVLKFLKGGWAGRPADCSF